MNRESQSPEMDRDELLDLLAERATDGLDAASAARLEKLLAEADEGEDHFDLAAASLELARVAADENAEDLPAAARERLRREARRFAAGLPPSGVTPLERPVPRSRFRPDAAGDTSLLRAPWLPWLVAAVLFVAAATGWWRVLVLSRSGDLRPTPPVVAAPAGVSPALIPQDRSPELARAALLASSGHTPPLPFAGTPDPAAQGVTGDVVWSPERQRGFLRFQNLPGNDPKVYQYQLWIFDATRDDRYPIDGGVFDVPATGEVVIPIEAKLEVREAALFAITIEKPGGAVVSSRERLVLLAKAI